MKTYSSGYTASKTRCCSIFEPERKFIAARGRDRQIATLRAEDHLTPYTPSPSGERNWCPDVDLLDKQSYESSDIERGNAIPQNTKSLEK